MPRNTLEFHALDLQDASNHRDLNDPTLSAPAGIPDIVICDMAPPAEFQWVVDGSPAVWDASLAAAVTAGVGILIGIGVLLHEALG